MIENVIRTHAIETNTIGHNVMRKPFISSNIIITNVIKNVIRTNVIKNVIITNVIKNVIITNVIKNVIITKVIINVIWRMSLEFKSL